MYLLQSHISKNNLVVSYEPGTIIVLSTKVTDIHDGIF